jgi:hypothetical protein
MNTKKPTTHTTAPHLDELNLELCRLGEGSSEDRAHLQSCELCRERMVRLEGVAADLHFQIPDLSADVFGDLDKKIAGLADENASRIQRTHKMRKRLVWIAPAALAAAAFVMVVIPGKMSSPTDSATLQVEEVLNQNAPDSPSPELPIKLADSAGDEKVQDIIDSPPPKNQSVTKPEDLHPELADVQDEGAGKLKTDVNGDGALNILDAYAMARALKAGEGNENWDQNGDGKVGARDVQRLAQAAVALSESTR